MSYISRVFSPIYLPLIKPVCVSDINMSKIGLILFAIHPVIIL